MRFRNWLLTGTSLTFLALAPLGVANAQDAADPALVAAYQTFQADQSEANKQALTEACITAGFANLDECIVALSAVAPVDQPSSSEEAAPPASSEEPAPPEVPSSEEVAPPAESSVEAPPAEASSSEAAPVAPSSEEAAPAPSSEEAVPPSSEEAAPPASSEEPAVDANADVLAQLTAAVNLYNEGVADLDAGDANGQVKIDQAQGQIDTICTGAGFADTASCLAQFGLALNPLPPAASSEQPVASEEPSEQPISELPNADEPVDENAVEVLPPEIAPEEAAPILDSAKDEENAVSEEPSDQVSEEPAPPEDAVPPPADDQGAQQDIQPPPPEDQSALTEEGQAKGEFDLEFAAPLAPETADVEIIETPSATNPTFIFKIGIYIYISNVRQERDRYYDPDADEIYYEDLSNGRVRETIIRPNGVKIVTIYNRYGEVLKRTKIYPDNREFYLATYQPADDSDGFWLDPGDELPPLRLTISAGDYILDADVADEDEVEFFLDQPPVEKVRRIYSIDEVKRSARIRDTVRRLEVGGLTFDTGKATISRDQVGALSKVAKAMLALLDRNPGEVFLVEGHTDAVGKDVPNLVLSDERAATVARILTDFYEVPPENLVTQGYGERYLKVKTEEAERLNRRVTIKRITPLVSYTADNG
ncbi:MAG: OmpA family protein [Devosia nanyangense]|uniref:OmpA family protein n=1 Tax=Devosia nanyangense TaxID=1228055 RepID=A0A933KX97_9HYPH|nr:OmpA family protein [Devosia nanyangense]